MISLIQLASYSYPILLALGTFCLECFLSDNFHSTSLKMFLVFWISGSSRGFLLGTYVHTHTHTHTHAHTNKTASRKKSSIHPGDHHSDVTDTIRAWIFKWKYGTCSKMCGSQWGLSESCQTQESFSLTRQQNREGYFIPIFCGKFKRRWILLSPLSGESMWKETEASHNLCAKGGFKESTYYLKNF